MKNFIIVLSTLLFCVNIQAQDDDNDGGSSSSHEKTPITISGYGTVGIRGLSVKETDIYFNYTDESPSHDHISRYFNLGKSKIAFDFRLGFNVGIGRWRLGAGFEGAINNTNLFAFEFGAGYNVLKSETVELVPTIHFLAGTTGVKLGDINNNAVYIEVNGTQFYSETAAVSLVSSLFSAKLGVETAIKLSDKIRFTAGVNFNIPFTQGKPKLHFSGKDEGGKSVSADETISANNVDLYMGDNYDNLTKSISNPMGIGVEVGVNYRFTEIERN